MKILTKLSSKLKTFIVQCPFQPECNSFFLFHYLSCVYRIGNLKLFCFSRLSLLKLITYLSINTRFLEFLRSCWSGEQFLALQCSSNLVFPVCNSITNLSSSLYDPKRCFVFSHFSLLQLIEPISFNIIEIRAFGKFSQVVEITGKHFIVVQYSSITVIATFSSNSVISLSNLSLKAVFQENLLILIETSSLMFSVLQI